MDTSDAVAEDFSAALDEHRRTIERTLTRLDAARMADHVEAFSTALERDLIDAGDFAGPSARASTPGR